MISNFTYYNPVKIIFGKDTIGQLGKNIPKDAKILLTYGGGSIFKNGVYDQVITALKGYEIIEFGGIEANPTFETLMKAVEIGRKEEITFLLAVGGGSVLDGTKFIAAAIPFKEGNEWENLACGQARFKLAIPIGSVMTLPATGSEMNYYAVISKASTHEKRSMGHPLLYPKFSILDPTTTYSLPPKQVANGIADAFTHVMEQYLTYEVGAEIQDGFSETILKTLIKEGPKTLASPEDYDARANLVWSATVALNGWINLGVPTDWATHQIGHELTALHGIDHARSLAVVLPYLLEHQKVEKRDKLIKYAKNVWFATGTDDELVEIAILKTSEFYETLGITTKGKFYNINEATIKTIRSRFEERGVVFGERKNIDGAAAESILRLSIA